MEEQQKEQQREEKQNNYGAFAGTIGRVIDVSAPDDTGAAGWRYDEENHVITIFSPSDYTLTGSTTENRIVIQKEEGFSRNFNLILQDLSIDKKLEPDIPPITIEKGILCRILIYENNNFLYAGENAAALNIKSGSDLEIDDLIPESNARLTIEGGAHAACIGANSGEAYGNIIIKGGALSITGKSFGSCIGYGDFNIEVQESNGYIDITGGNITCTSDLSATYMDGIRCASLNIANGYLSTHGSNQGSGIAFIMQNSWPNYTIWIKNAARVNAFGGYQRPGINLFAKNFYSTLTIDDGYVQARGSSASGIGFYSNEADFTQSNTDIIINGGFIDAYGGYEGLGIGSTSVTQIGKIEINGGVVNAYGGAYCAGLGSSGRSHIGKIVINGGQINAFGGVYGSGIGNQIQYNSDNKETIEINGGEIRAYGGSNGAGIGSGNNSPSDDIIINNGVITAIGGNRAAGIGGGDYGNAGKIKINGGLISSYGNSGGAGIGGGYHGTGNDIYISSSASVVAESRNEYTYDIGDGSKGSSYYSGLYSGMYTGHYSGEIDGIYQGELSGLFKGTVYRDYTRLIDASFKGAYTGKAKGKYTGFFKGRFSGYLRK